MGNDSVIASFTQAMYPDRLTVTVGVLMFLLVTLFAYVRVPDKTYEFGVPLKSFGFLIFECITEPCRNGKRLLNIRVASYWKLAVNVVIWYVVGATAAFIYRGDTG